MTHHHHHHHHQYWRNPFRVHMKMNENPLIINSTFNFRLKQRIGFMIVHNLWNFIYVNHWNEWNPLEISTTCILFLVNDHSLIPHWYTAVTWLKYCQYSVKLYPINQSINQSIFSFTFDSFGCQCKAFHCFSLRFIVTSGLYHFVFFRKWLLLPFSLYI